MARAVWGSLVTARVGAGLRCLESTRAVRPEEVEVFFPEFRPFVPGCHFPDCSHEHETGCAVKRAVDRDLISPVRYASYLRIISGADE